jgi:hypothetical protein
MRSLKLNIDDLSVDTFVAGKAATQAGTVRAHESDEGGGTKATGFVTCDSTCWTCPTGIANACCV